MRPAAVLAALALAAPAAHAADILIQGARLYDGGGGAPVVADVRVHGDRIAAVAPQLRPRAGEALRPARGLALAPGFIDMHSHGDRHLLADLDAATVARQGVTTIVVGQDGESNFPLAAWLGRLDATPAAINVASMAGHATLRTQVMGRDLYRPASAAEVARMGALLEQELAAGAFGLSTGLEYEEAHSATTEEVIALARVAARAHGFYISHVRDEADGVFAAFDEVLRIGREAHLPVEITHIKLGSPAHWHEAASRVPGYFAAARREHVDLKADVYPYPYWHSTIRVLVPDRDFENPQKVAAGLAANGGAAAVRLARYVPDRTLEGLNLAQIAERWGTTPVEAYIRIVRATAAEADGGERLEDVIVAS
ncbi:MAG: amidohydrolase family protein, partial [Proteobacteria bacterium]|nr:amidohydrolase family protein [Pseudomonadota bacterium]